jgi:hypothetical protein
MEQANNNNANGNNRRTVQKMSAAFDPRQPALVQPYKRLVEEGFITVLTAKFTPEGFTCLAKPDGRLAAVEGANLNVEQEYPVGILSMWADKGNLIPLKGKNKSKGSKAGPEQPLPAKSLCKKDFEATDAELSARAVAVANASGGASLIGRVRSEKAFTLAVTTSFQDWWRLANGEQRASALCTPRYRGELSEADVNKLANLQCPFRGTAEFTVQQEENSDDEEEEAEPTPVATKATGAGKAATTGKTPVRQ